MYPHTGANTSSAGHPASHHGRSELEEDLRKDQVSHYILRMAYSRTEELR